MTETVVDVVVVGSGAGGGTLARALAGSDVSVLVVERGGWLPQEKQNWDPTEVWRKQRYRESETWVNRRGEDFQPFMHYLVGGNTKFWGAVLYRLREEDFTEVAHVDGSPRVAHRLSGAGALLRPRRGDLPGARRGRQRPHRPRPQAVPVPGGAPRTPDPGGRRPAARRGRDPVLPPARPDQPR
ncbi:MAG: hypothetical protein U0R78_09665 [Nocardioidaceae bacterium]